MDGFLTEDKYHTPYICKKCGGVLVYQGIGEYSCEDCGAPDYDDYGKVRRFIEGHNGATAAQIELATGVSQKTIRQMLKDGRLEVAANSIAFLQCEVCGKAIRSGRFCTECEMSMHRQAESKLRDQIKKSIQGFGLAQNGDEGRKRFTKRS